MIREINGNNCALLFTELFLYSYEADFMHGLLKKKRKEVRSFNFKFLYIDDALTLNNYKLCNFIDVIYPTELEIKYTADIARSHSYLDLHFAIDNEGLLSQRDF